jgi:hypothetical protein
MSLNEQLEYIAQHIKEISGKNYPDLTQSDMDFLKCFDRLEEDKAQNGGKYIFHFVNSDLLIACQEQMPTLRLEEFLHAFSLEMYLSNSDFNYLYHQTDVIKTPLQLAELMHKDGRLSTFISDDFVVIDEFVKLFA